jgi:putative spermidine/putrescine transport system permease protein
MSRIGHYLAEASWVVIIAFAYLVVLAPILVLIFSSFDGGEIFRFPPQSYSLRWYEAAFNSQEYRSALGVSTLVGSLAALVSVVFGALGAYALARSRFRGAQVIETILLAPLALPLIVWAIALLQIYAWLGVSGSFPGLFIAHATITMPFTLRIMVANFSQLDPSLEEAAASLGAPPLTAFRRITLPLVAPGLVLSAAFSFLVSFNDVIVSSFVAGARWITFPVRLYSQLRSQGVDPITVAIGAAIVALILIAGLGGEKLFKWSRQL